MTPYAVPINIIGVDASIIVIVLMSFLHDVFYESRFHLLRRPTI